MGWAQTRATGGVPQYSIEERISAFFRKVYKTRGCWIWTGCIVRGYGQFRGPDRRRVYAHRFLYEELNGKIEQSLTLDHLCRNRACVNPSHLEPVSAAENIRRGAQYRKAKAQLDRS